MCKKFILLISLCFALALAGSAFGQVVWDNGDLLDQLWKSSLNWDTDAVPTSLDHAWIVLTEPAHCIIDGNHVGGNAAEADLLSVGKSGTGGGHGDLRMTGGSLTVYSGKSYIGNNKVGRFYMEDGNATFNGAVTIANNTGATGSLLRITGGTFATSSGNNLTLGNKGGGGTIDMQGGTLQVGKQLQLGWGGYPVGGTINIDDGTINVSNYLTLGTGGGYGSVTMQGGAINAGGDFRLGDGGTVGMTMTGGTINCDDFDIGRNSGIGDMTMNGGTINADGGLDVGNGGTGTFDMQAGIIDANDSYLNIGNDGGDGEMTMSGGTITADKGARVGNDSLGKLYMNGGTIYVGTEQNTKPLQVGYNGGTGTITMTDGAINISAALNVGNDGSDGTLNMDGGTITTAGACYVGTGSGVGTLNMTAGTIDVGTPDSTKAMNIGRESGNGEVNMEGGTINVSGNLGIGKTTEVNDINVPGTGILTMTDGRINIGNNLQIGTDGSTGHLQLDGSTIYADDLVMGEDPCNPGDPCGTMDITDGVLVLNGDDRGDVDGYYKNGWITVDDVNHAENPRLLFYGYNQGTDKTTVRAKTEEELALAYNPTPGYDAVRVFYDVNLIWSPGEYAKDANGHDVYLGTDFDEVNDADTSDPNVYKGNRDANEYYAGILELGETYYWRIDEVNDNPWAPPGSPWKGEVWDFPVRPYLTVEDFEDYNETTNPISNTWNELGQAWLFLATDRGRQQTTQSIQVEYANHLSPYYSQIDRDVDDPNWTKFGVKALALWFYGDPDNDANQPMYVIVEDQSANKAVVKYERDDPNEQLETSWHRWDIELQELADKGVVLTEVDNIAIRIGDGNYPGGIAYGNIYFEDIRLFIPMCRKSSNLFPKDGFTPYGVFAGLNNGCSVDYEDLEIMADDWLLTDFTLTRGLVGKWDFDEGDGSTVTDLSGKDHNGTLIGYGTGWIDWDDDAIYFDPCSDPCYFDPEDPCDEGAYVEMPKSEYFALSGEGGNRVGITWAAWIKYTGELFDINDVNQTIIAKANPEGAANDRFNGQSAALALNDNLLEFKARNDAVVSFDTIDVYEWTHVAVTVEFQTDGNKDTVTLYIDSVQASASNAEENRQRNNADYVIMVGAHVGDYKAFCGWIDDVQIYDRALSADEIEDVMDGYIAPNVDFYYPLDSNANVHSDDQIINFKDYAILADRWLVDPESVFWP